MRSKFREEAETAIREFYVACAEPLSAYQERLAAIQVELDSKLSPYKEEVASATNDCDHLRQRMNYKKEKAAPELNKRFNELHSQAYTTYKTDTAPNQQLRELMQQLSFKLYDEQLAWRVGEPELGSDIHLSTSAILQNIDGDVRRLGGREAAQGFVFYIVHELFRESLKGFEESLDALIKPLEEQLNAAKEQCSQELSGQLKEANENLTKAEARLKEAEKVYFRQSLEERAKARAVCESAMKPLREQLREKLKPMFDSLA